MTKGLDTLVEDVYALFDSETTHTVDEKNLDDFCTNLKDLIRSRLSASHRSEGEGVLRFSSLGRSDRQLWYMANRAGEGEVLSGKTSLKFMYGDVIEQLLLLLVKEAGHSVEREQEEIEVDGVKGHIDAIIDGVTVDVKSASPHAFPKFSKGTLFDDDPFGYISQISGYASTLTPDQGGAFLAMDKVHGDLAVLRVGPTITNSMDVGGRIAHLREAIKNEEPPPRCHPDEPDGQSGNRKLSTQCSYCPFKFDCWKDTNGGRGLRTFMYSGRPKFLTVVKREPNVAEVPQ